MYIKGPSDPNVKHNLRGFKRISLKPKQKVVVDFEIDSKSLSSYSDEGEDLMKEGKYTIYVGNVSPGARSTALGGTVLTSTLTYK